MHSTRDGPSVFTYTPVFLALKQVIEQMAEQMVKQMIHLFHNCISPLSHRQHSGRHAQNAMGWKKYGIYETKGTAW
ncbi:hypothetical protein GCM10025858_21170 [Alicyclobacillus sacchari]|nr:hypothetical protein GCM10025858_21170 [Alicyclobacillus sacchari]